MHFTKVKGILSSKSCTHGCIYCDSRSKCYYDQMLDAYNIRLKDRLNIYYLVLTITIERRCSLWKNKIIKKII